MNEEIDYINFDKISDFAFDYTRDFLINECHYNKDDVMLALLEIDERPVLSKLFDKVCKKMLEILTYSKEDKIPLNETIRAYCIALGSDLKNEIEAH